MSFDSFLNQTCDITRPTATEEANRYNDSAFEDETVAENVRCRLIEKSVRKLDAKTEEYTWIKAKVLLLPAGTDVKTKDKATIGSVVYQIQETLNRQRGNNSHHLSCIVETFNG